MNTTEQAQCFSGLEALKKSVLSQPLAKDSLISENLAEPRLTVPAFFQSFLIRRRLRGLRRDDANALIEFAFAFPVLITVLMVVVTGGLVFNRHMTVMQLGRNAASMFSAGTDFAKNGNKQLLMLAAEGLRIQLDGGDGVVYLTRVVKAAPGSTNEGELVIAERHVIGNPSLRDSEVGQPDDSIWPDPDNPNPNGDVKDYSEEASAIATLPANLDTLPLGESMYVAEVYHTADDLNLWPLWNDPLKLATTVYF